MVDFFQLLILTKGKKLMIIWDPWIFSKICFYHKMSKANAC